MNTENKEEKKAVSRVEVTLKKPLIQSRVQKKAGDKIKVTPDQKKRLTESGHI